MTGSWLRPHYRSRSSADAEPSRHIASSEKAAGSTRTQARTRFRRDKGASMTAVLRVNPIVCEGHGLCVELFH
jgi:hypothetical protein